MSSIRKADVAIVSPQDEECRIARERLLIAQARASVATGAIVADDAVDGWLDHMVDSDQPMPIPEPRRRRVGA